MVSAATKSKVQSIISEHPVAVFSKSYCPYCRATKQTLSGLGAKFYVIELDQVDDGSEIQQALRELTGQSTVPNVFVGGKHVGGNDKLQVAARNGSLEAMVTGAGAGAL